jgi:cation transport ATPase
MTRVLPDSELEMFPALEWTAMAESMSSEARNALGQPTAYKLIPTMSTPTLLADPESSAQKINLTLGVIGHEGSTVVVVLNALRLLRVHND